MQVSLPGRGCLASDAYHRRQLISLSGGLAVCTLVVSPKAKGLFRRAIIQSGACAGPWGPGTTEEGMRMSERIMARPAANTTNLAELQELPPWTLGVWNTSAFFQDQLFPGYWIDNW